MAGMTEQHGRMTYEQQRALREQERQRGQQRGQSAERPQRSERIERTVDRYTIDQYAGGRKAANASPRSRSQQGASRRSAAHSKPARQANADATPANRTTRAQFSRQNYGNEAAKRIPVVKIGIAIVLIVAVVVGVQLCSAITPINVTVNGTQYELRGAKTVQTAIKASGLPINPGDLISLNGNILEKSKGDPFAATVNGQETADPNFGLLDGDVITVTDGKDIVEEYDATESKTPYSATITGVGSVHKFAPGVEGVNETRTGRVSGETVEKRVTDPQNATCTEYNLNAGQNKVVAFTFDDGPLGDQTSQVLDILKENDAKATFFVIGTEVESYPDLVKREAAEGHQVCTHSYDHAEPVGGTDVGLMDAAGQVDEIVHGMKTITDVLGGEASRVVRMPGGNMDETMVLNLLPYVDYEIGWNIDTQDWQLPGAEAIYQQMISAQPGDIILCHDGGGDRSQTIEALRRALPYLKSKGFSFLTMDEMLAYPPSS